MFKTKNMLFVLLISALMLVLAACGSDDDSSTSSDGGTTTTTDKDSGSEATADFGDVKFLSILTGGTQGTYYPLGGTFADLITTDTGVKTTAEVSQASAANMTALAAGEGEVAFVQTDIAYYATQGTLMFEGQKMDSVVALGALYPETIQLVTLADSGIKSFADLKGKRVSVGAPGSGTYANAEQLLEIHGLTMDDIKAQNLDFGESTDGIQSGQIDAAFITAGYPTGAVEALNATNGVYIVPVEADKAAELIAKYPYYAVDKIPSGTYGLESDVPAVSVGAMLAVKKDLPEDLVYAMTKAIYDNTDKIGHAKGAFIKAETGLDGIGIDVHPGAQKYFDEVK
ncbi:immunogenic protein [Lysinibacillus sp. 2017]|uniref:TAXI family TRAP transporter solute-binding subunit n=1 Tax=unclassified Lysinibacillus TaxID=2636778 RepID=UPI000D529429|nr:MULTISPECIES: TAXI family TRAP transporter solute-binding subunit [unclassified Lysinibacillus]AWE06108.1 immunogenic protein [Lysinibacillus sp. 2017]TGN30758.1 TAXI family TRAP transporter solute-binding subunit [Lysinibacillus sp. S2017]